MRKKIVSIITLVLIVLLQTNIYARYTGASNVQTYTGVNQGYNYNYTSRWQAGADILETYRELKDAAAQKKIDSNALQDKDKILGAVSNTSGMLEEMGKNKYCDVEVILERLYGSQKEEMRKKYFLKSDGSTMTLAEVYDGLDSAENSMLNAANYETNAPGGAHEEITAHEEKMETQQKKENAYASQEDESTQSFGAKPNMSYNSAANLITDPTDDASYYKPDDLNTSNANKLVSKAGTILGIIRNIGVALGVVALTIIGLRYMLGSVEEKAEYKETMIPYIIGAILLIGGTVLIDAIYSLASNFG